MTDKTKTEGADKPSWPKDGTKNFNKGVKTSRWHKKWPHFPLMENLNIIDV